MKFTSQQVDAIKHFEGPALILAVPGSGKTTVLLNRILNLIKNHNIDPSEIISITFSKSQGIDMEKRFLAQNPEFRGKITFKTIHAFCYEIVRNYMKLKNIKKTLIEGNNEFNRILILKRVYYQKNYKKPSDEEINDFFSIYDYTKNKMYDFEGYIRKNHFISNRSLMLKLYNLYDEIKIQNNFMDFNDLLILANEYISTDKKLLKALKNRYKFFQIDEGQDTSTLQFEIIRKIVFPENNVFIVADDDQSIYSFRGASPENLLNFKNIYPNSKIFFMDKNFRSTKNIIKISNKIIQGNKIRYEKTSKHTTEESSQIMLFKVKNSIIQARELLKRISEINPNETIGILYRNNVSSLYVADILKNNDIDFFVKENKFDFYSNRILNDVKNILSFSEDTSDLEVFKRIYFKLNAYIKKDFITKLEYKPYNQCILESLLDLDELNDFYLNKFTSLRNNFKRLKRMKMEDKIDCILYEIGYGDYLDNFNDFSNLNYNLIFDLIKYLSKDLKTFGEFIEKLDKLKELLKNASSSKSNISISTIHSAKGLEYDNVFIIDLIDGEFPQKSVLNSFDEKLLEEERRLFYVAMTRARKRLFLFTIKERNNLPVESSIFYNELKNKY
ncbi:ATP-dependent helicase [Parvimonas micra]|uniref:DNA 3'-5' helicase n=1 Tax=Parvimonas micra ATCC 33270 TaxID=411465 RepID=A8SMD3_9FIRM|nr:ATP-dependent helicase [Parvimonas micra]EDP23479.1 UvrD/REP helicase [Parvimonas micra ATCC 33270]RSB90884.1 ATP-dependent helicase [Parvimonas micra]VEH98137.1 Putative ATP-dependent DNA helicase yjcD [Parvimonas micra]